MGQIQEVQRYGKIPQILNYTGAMETIVHRHGVPGGTCVILGDDDAIGHEVALEAREILDCQLEYRIPRG